jgi:hypothetical protein
LPSKRSWEMRSLNTHLYQGARLLHSEPGDLEFKPGDVLTITFSDTIQTNAEVIGAAEDLAKVSVDSYRTRRGATIVSKKWFIRKVAPVGRSVCYSVIGRAY